MKLDGTVLGFDVGARRIGVAVGSAFGTGARALAVIDVHGHGPDWPAIDKLHAEWKPDGLVVGDPMTLEGGDQPNRKRAHAFARELRTRYQLPVVLVDDLLHHAGHGGAEQLCGLRGQFHGALQHQAGSGTRATAAHHLRGHASRLSLCGGPGDRRVAGRGRGAGRRACRHAQRSAKAQNGCAEWVAKNGACGRV